MRQPTTPQSRVTLRVLAAACAVAAVIGLSPAVQATAASGDPSNQREQVRKKRAEVASRLNVLKANSAEIHRALDAIERNVSAQQARVAAARQAAATAEAQLAQAQQAEVDKQAELDALRQRVRQLAVDAYINPTTGELAATLNAKSLADATRKRELLEFRMNRSGDLVDRLAAAREDLGIKRQEAELARAQALDRKKGVESQLAVYQRSLNQQLAFAQQVALSACCRLVLEASSARWSASTRVRRFCAVSDSVADTGSSLGLSTRLPVDSRSCCCASSAWRWASMLMVLS